MVKITANSRLIKGNNRSGEAGCVLHDVTGGGNCFQESQDGDVYKWSKWNAWLFVCAECGSGACLGLDESSPLL